MSYFGGGLGGQVLGLVILSLFAVSRGNFVASGRSIVPDFEPPGVHSSDDHVWGHGLPEAYYCTIHHDVLCGYADMPFHYDGTGDNNPANIVWDGNIEPQPETRESNTQVNPAQALSIDSQISSDLTLGNFSEPREGDAQVYPTKTMSTDSQFYIELTLGKRGHDSHAYRLTPSCYLIAFCLLVSVAGVYAMESRPTTPPYIMSVAVVAEWGYVASNAFMSTGPHPSRANSPASTRPPSPVYSSGCRPSICATLIILLLMGVCFGRCGAVEILLTDDLSPTVVLADDQVYTVISDWAEVAQRSLAIFVGRIQNATLNAIARPVTLASALDDDEIGSWYWIRVASKEPVVFEGPALPTANETAYGFCPCHITYVSSELDVFHAYDDCHILQVACGYSYQNVTKGFFVMESCVRGLWSSIVLLMSLIVLFLFCFCSSYVLGRLLYLPPNEQTLWNFVAKNELDVGANLVDFLVMPVVGDLAAVDDSVHAEWRNKFCWRHNLANLMRRLGFVAEGVLLEATSQNRRTRLAAGRTLLAHRDTIFAVRARVLNKLARENVVVDNEMNRSIVNREVLNVVRSMSVAGGPFFNRDVDVSRLISMMVSSVFLQTVYDEIGDEVAFGPEGRPL